MQTMLTTIDNPYSPFDQFIAWNTWDVAAGYQTIEFLGRILIDSDEQSETDQELAIELAIDEIVRENVSGVYKKVTKD